MAESMSEQTTPTVTSNVPERRQNRENANSGNANETAPRRNYHNNNYFRRNEGRGGYSRGGYHREDKRAGSPTRRTRTLNLSKFRHLAGADERVMHGSVKMLGETAECDICCRKSDLFALGACLHPICMECAIRIRIIGKSETCPNCRANIDMLYFVPFSGDWESFTPPSDAECVEHPDCSRYKLRLANDYVARCYASYLAHVCPLCEKRGEKREFRNFASLNQHVYMVHKFVYCDICSAHLDLLSRERRIYTSVGLEHHLKEGDSDDQSQKGHPQCLFCEKRFLDEEYRYKHLRKDHFFCQICDEDSFGNNFFGSHRQLLVHYKKDHIVCEEGECKQLGIAFRTENELKFHKSSEHSAGRQTLDLDFRYSGRNVGEGARGGYRGGRGGDRGSAPHHPAPPLPTNLPRVGVIPAEPPPERPKPADPNEVVIVPSAQVTGAAGPSLRYGREPFRMEGNDFPRLGTGRPTSARASTTTANIDSSSVISSAAVRHPQATTSLQRGTGSSSAKAAASSTVAAGSTAASSSWFIDEDELFPPHRPFPAKPDDVADASKQEYSSQNESLEPTEARGAPSEAEVPPSLTSKTWTGMRRPNSLSGIASALAENGFPSLAAGGYAAPKNNLPAKSAWSKNNLRFHQSASSSAIASCVVPADVGGRKPKGLPVPDIWPEEKVPASWEDRDEPSEGENLKPLVGKKMEAALQFGGEEETTKKKSKKEKGKQKQIVEGKQKVSQEPKVENAVGVDTVIGSAAKEIGNKKLTNEGVATNYAEPNEVGGKDKENLVVNVGDAFPSLVALEETSSTSDAAASPSSPETRTFSQILTERLSSWFTGNQPNNGAAQKTEEPFGEGEDFPSLRNTDAPHSSERVDSVWSKVPSRVKSEQYSLADHKQSSLGGSGTQKMIPVRVSPPVGVPPGLGHDLPPPGLAPPPGFGPPPGFEDISARSSSAGTSRGAGKSAAVDAGLGSTPKTKGQQISSKKSKK